MAETKALVDVKRLTEECIGAYRAAVDALIAQLGGPAMRGGPVYRRAILQDIASDVQMQEAMLDERGLVLGIVRGAFVGQQWRVETTVLPHPTPVAEAELGPLEEPS